MTRVRTVRGSEWVNSTLSGDSKAMLNPPATAGGSDFNNLKPIEICAKFKV